jgi:hypothetical protein
MYGYDDTPPPPSGSKSDHARVVTSGAWLGALLVCAFPGWADAQVPYVCAWLLNSAVILPATYAVARHKRVWYGWACFWVLAAVCAAAGIMRAATSWLDSPWSNAAWVCGWLFAWAFYWLIRAPRRQEPAVQQVVHVHHHVLHAGVQPGWDGAEVTQVSGTGMHPVTATSRKAIAPAPLSPGDLGQRIGRLAGRIRDRK